MPRPVDQRATYFPGLDGIRALAVALVIAYHVGVPHMGGGLLGVGVFFTLSGYLITSLLLTSWYRKHSLGLKTFWIRRARRLLPAVVLVLIAVLITTAVIDSGKLHDRGVDALGALFYVANWVTIAKGDTYFNRFNGPSPLEHLWSLSVEEQFYVIWPLLLLALLTVLRGRLVRVAFVTFLLGTASMILLAVLAPSGMDATRAYEGTDTRAGGLLWGAALAFLWHPVVAGGVSQAKHRVLLEILGLAGLGGVIALVAFTTETSMFIYRGGIALLTVATCALIAACMTPGTFAARLFSLAALRWIGERTYGLYLWHMPVSAFLPERTLYGNTVARGAIVVILTVLLAALSWRYVEDPIRRHGFRAALLGLGRGASSPRSSGQKGSGRGVAAGVLAGATALAVGSAAAMAVVAKLPQDSVQEIAKKEANKQASGGKAPAAASHKAKPDATKTSCQKVVHIGDSTSLGLEDGPDTNVTDPKKRIRAQYQSVGVQTVDEDIKGGRNIFEHFGHDTNGKEAVAAQVAKGYKGCWVIALGMNDAATMAKGGSGATADQRIDLVMKQIGNQPVLWVNTVTQAWTNNPLYANKNMQDFNKHIVDATKRYPNLRVYDWASEALPHPEWFLQDDANHNNGVGSAAKAHGIAEALVAAFPRGSDPSSDKVVASK